MTYRVASKWIGVCALALAFAACSSTSGTSTDGGTAGTGDAAVSDGAAGSVGNGTTGSAGHDASVIDGLIMTIPGDGAVNADTGAPTDTGASTDTSSDVASTDASGADAGDAQGSEVGVEVGVDGATDAVVALDGPSIDAGSLCVAANVGGSTVAPTNVPTGAPPAASTYTGGPIASGTYVLTSVTHYGPNYGGPPQASYTFDAAKQTLRIAETFGGGAYYYVGLATSNLDAHTLQGFVECNSSPFAFPTFVWSYTVSGPTLTLSQVGSLDVSVYTKQ